MLGNSLVQFQFWDGVMIVVSVAFSHLLQFGLIPRQVPLMNSGWLCAPQLAGSRWLRGKRNVVYGWRDISSGCQGSKLQAPQKHKSLPRRDSPGIANSESVVAIGASYEAGIIAVQNNSRFRRGQSEAEDLC